MLVVVVFRVKFGESPESKLFPTGVLHSLAAYLIPASSRNSSENLVLSVYEQRTGL